jgi:hypothetical protein
MAESKGIFEGFDFDPELTPSIIDSFIWAKKGDRVVDPATHKLGIVFIEHADSRIQMQRVPRLQKMLYAMAS